jgi:hypothetical protein
MTDARVEPVYEDRVRAREFLAQSERFFTDANRSGLAAESRSVLFHNAAVCACDAILQAAGLRVTVGDRSHVLRIETALAQIPGDTEELLDRLDASRERRNDASYAADFVAQTSIEDAHEATAELIEHARRFTTP